MMISAFSIAVHAVVLSSQHITLPVAARCRAPILCSSPSEYEQKEADLARAVASEDFAVAATLRDELASMVVDDQLAILSVNGEFYSAFASGDFDRMSEVWADDDLTCLHPMSPPIHGFDEVMNSWKQILNGARMEIKAEKVRCKLIGGMSAVVTCFEVVEGATPLAATNVFAKSTASGGRVPRARLVAMQPGCWTRCCLFGGSGT